MRTVNSDFLRSYDKFREDVFHSKKEEHKQNLRNKAKPLQPISFKKIFPWKTFTKLTTVTGVAYLAYNYTDSLIDQIINKNYFTVIDLMALKVIKEDISVKLKMLIKNPREVKNLSHFANYMYKNELETGLNYLKKIYPTHKLKSSIHSGLKIWIFQFNNYEKSQYVNEFGDVIERDENSFMRIWRYPVFKDRKEKVIKEEKVYEQYRTITENSDSKKGKKEVIENEIVGKCEKINIFNRFSSEYEELLTECKKNESYGQAFTKVIENRKKLYPYSSFKVESKSENPSTSK